jgi:AcrR family transcriptional regulator
MSTQLAPARPEADHRRATAERNIEAILDTAESLLRSGTTPSIVAVAKGAGVSRVTVYAHFNSLELLLTAVLERAVARATVAFREATSGTNSAMDALERAVRASWGELTRNRSIADAAGAHLSAETIRAAHEDAYAHARRVFEDGVAQGEFRSDVPVEWLLTVYYSLLHAAGDDVRAGRIEADTALLALTTTMSAAFAPARR